MKKLMLLIMAAAMFIATPAVAQNKALSKALKKELSTKKKELAKGGWEIFGTSRSLDVALLKHYEALEDGMTEWVGYGEGKSKNIVSTQAQTNAANRYAQASDSKIKGQIKTQMEGNSTDVTEEVDKFSAIYLTKVESEIKGALKHSYSVIRTNSQGVSEVRAYFLVNEPNAAKARKAAFEAACKEAGISTSIAVKISAIIGEQVEAEE